MARPEGAEQVLSLETRQLRPNPSQPRRSFQESEIQELARSIQTTGMLQPILARPSGGGFEIVAGERRWRAARLAGLDRVPVIVREIADDQVLLLGLVENLHREDLNPIEKARALQAIQASAKCTTEEVARRVGLDRSTIANLIRLLELPDSVLAHVSRGTLSMGHARALLGVPGSDAQRDLADEIVRRELSVRQVEEAVARARVAAQPPRLDETGRPKSRRPGPEAWTSECEEALAASLRAKVRVRSSGRRMKIQIECEDREQFDRVFGSLLANRLG